MKKKPQIRSNCHLQALKNRGTTVLSSIIIGSIITFSSAFADDTEVFFGQADPTLDVHPNVLFVLDTSGSMNYTDSGSSGTRLERMQEALGTILDSTTNVNVGMMRFNGSDGGGAVLFPITSIDEEICESDDCGSVSLINRTRSGDDDVEQNINTGKMSLSNASIYLGRDSSSNYQHVGLRFTDINIPKGVKIETATIEFNSVANTSSSANAVIRGELSADADSYNSSNHNLSNRSFTSSDVTWSIPKWETGLSYSTPELKSVVQEIVDQDDWCGGNAMSFALTGDGYRPFAAYNYSPTLAPVLKITYDSTSMPTTGSCAKKIVVSAISASTDDVLQLYINGAIVSNARNLPMPRRGSRQALTGLRFQDIKIPKNSRIKEASIEFEVNRYVSTSVTIGIQVENSDNPATFTTTRYNLQNRNKLSSTVSWSPPASSVNAKVSTPDLSSLVQSTVDRSGWESGNAMAFYFSRISGNGYRDFESLEGEPAAAAKLSIVYEATSSSESETSTITARDKLKEVVYGLTAYHGTPIVDAYYEAAQYYRGEGVDYGTQRGHSSYTSRYHRVSVPESYTGGSVYRHSYCTDANLDSNYCTSEKITGNPKYISPIQSSCQTNSIVFLSDGEATSNSSSKKVLSMIGKKSCSGSSYEACGVDLARWLAETDHMPYLNANQTITTFTIGFNFSGSFLPAIAAAGEGDFHTASSAQELVSVFQNILGEVLSVDTSFVAPGATVNQFNRLTHRNDIYFSLFKPRQSPSWQGNLKRYNIGQSDGTTVIQDVNGSAAIDDSTGFFADNSRSWWSQVTDGNAVALGGAAEQLEFSSQSPRRIYTYVGNYSAMPDAGVDITNAVNALSENSTRITISAMGLNGYDGTTSERLAYKTELLQWARGIDLKDEDDDGSTTDWRQHMGDPMHSRPVLLNYKSSSGSYTSSIFVGTNDGYLHSIDSETGEEIYSYMPKEFLQNIQVLYEDQSSDLHPYGLDGHLTLWNDDTNGNIAVDSGEKAYLYVGMRRGGNNYYAFDVSDRDNLKLAWVIEGGTGEFEELGQTWSKPQHAKIYFSGNERDVLIFGAGYDENQDPASNGQTVNQSTDEIGRGIFIVDAETGERIWAAFGTNDGDQKFADMDYSIPSNLTLIDADYDGLLDQIFVGDMGGQLWRFDFQPYHTSGPLLSGGVMAHVGGNAYKDQRRFYYAPDVATVKANNSTFLTVGIGSGWRAHPLDLNVEDRFYVFKSEDVTTIPSGYGKTSNGGNSYSPITEKDLTNIDDTNDLTSSEYGWYIELESEGEKVLGSSVTIDNKILFTSYQPALSVGECSTAIGGGNVYYLDVVNGDPAVDLNEDGSISNSDRSKTLTRAGIPPGAAVLLTSDDNGVGSMAAMVSTEQPIDDLEADFHPSRTFWLDASDDISE